MTSFCVAKLLSIITNIKIIVSTNILIHINCKLKNKNNIELITNDKTTKHKSICLLSIYVIIHDKHLAISKYTTILIKNFGALNNL